MQAHQPTKINPEIIYDKVVNSDLTWQQIADTYGIGIATVTRYVRKVNQSKGIPEAYTEHRPNALTMSEIKALAVNDSMQEDIFICNDHIESLKVKRSKAKSPEERKSLSEEIREEQKHKISLVNAQRNAITGYAVAVDKSNLVRGMPTSNVEIPLLREAMQEAKKLREEREELQAMLDETRP
jgi:hypothetical protein